MVVSLGRSAVPLSLIFPENALYDSNSRFLFRLCFHLGPAKHIRARAQSINTWCSDNLLPFLLKTTVLNCMGHQIPAKEIVLPSSGLHSSGCCTASAVSLDLTYRK